ncbi:MAG: hypothetical protein NTV51_22195 [Verrucomicrobia bacterium]|nr:hypothetical protein [Verrucomicrobiota bacterium]
MKRLLLLLFLPLALIAAPAPIIPNPPRPQVRWDFVESLSPIDRVLRESEVIDRTPLFINAPFLRLRPGDKLVRFVSGPSGKDFMTGETRTGYYLHSSGKNYSIEATEEPGGIRLNSTDASAVLLFDWEVNEANANSLYALLLKRQFNTLTSAQWDAITTAARKDFPEIEISAPPYQYYSRSEVVQLRLISIPGQSYAVFSGVAFNEFDDAVYQFSVSIGPHVARILGTPLLQVPRYVHREEFEGYHSNGFPNAGPPFDVDPATAKIKKAEYDRMIAFQTLVKEAMKSRDAP